MKTIFGGITMQKMMFNDYCGLTAAVVVGSKTMTRRVITQKTLDKVLGDFRQEYFEASLDGLTEQQALDHYFFTEYPEKLPFKIGEVVAVAQNYKDLGYQPSMIQYGRCVRKGSYPKDSGWDDSLIGNTGYWCIDQLAGWTNKMFVLPEMCYHRIQITGVRIERLQDISDEDCLREGIRLYTTGIPQCKTQVVGSLEFIPPYGFDDYKHKQFRNFDTPRAAFASLIDKVSGKGTWERNPWVFVYEFKLIK